jgi:hypothetical protein
VPAAIVTVGAPESTIDVSVAFPTVSSVFPLTVPNVAVIVIGAAVVLNAVANPVAEIVTSVVFEEDQVTIEVRFWVVLLLYVPVAVNCVSVPTGIVSFAGVTAIEFSTGAVTVSVAGPLATPPMDAVIIVVP